MARLYKKVCEQCNTAFDAQRPNGRFCGNSCKQKSYLARRNNVAEVEFCVWCKKGKIKVADYYDGFCAPGCARAAAEYVAAGGACQSCGALCIGQIRCRCGQRLDVR